jgi:hypothetical protein
LLIKELKIYSFNVMIINNNSSVALAKELKNYSFNVIIINNNSSVALVRERTIPTERPQLVGEVRVNFCGVSASESYGRNLGFLDRSCCFFFQVAPQLYCG